jgi:spermidine/putrescine transport system substrate-binding protein
MVILKNSENKDAAYAFVDFILDAKNHGWAAENILYKVPNKPAMDSLSAEFLESFPNMAIGAEQLLSYEQLRDVGEGQRLYARTVSEIKAAQ